MNKVISFKSGNEYSLADLFGGDTKIIIPDLQRDYCWGNNAVVDRKTTKTKDLVSDFVKNIIELYEEKAESSLTMGLVYGYEQPHAHIQICDGQQRLTTLFLLLGYINNKCKGIFDDYIISEQEREDDFEPHLQYAIRESTLYFLSDLSRNVFINRNTEVRDIKLSNWYFNEYDHDASIQSMISALETIENVFCTLEFFHFEELGRFVLNNLKVLYYDMDNRSRGEETYVVINTTGEPLSSTENIKPILLGSPSLTPEQVKMYSDQWEDREEWFWNHRGSDTTADSGMKDFFMWYWQIGLMQERAWINDKPLPLNPRELFINVPTKMKESSKEVKLSKENYDKFRSLDNINKYFNALETLVRNIATDTELQSVLHSIQRTQKKNKDLVLNTEENVWQWLRNVDLDVVLPLIVLLAEHPNTNQLKPFTRRVRRNYFDGLWSKTANNELSRRGANKMDWRYLIQIINQVSEDKLLTVDNAEITFSKIPLIDIPIWYDKNERIKAKLRKDYPKYLEQWEDNEYLMGDLTPLWDDCDEENVVFEAIEKKFQILDKLCRMLHEDKIQPVDYQFANWFRLYRVISGLVGFGHVPNTIWDFEGCYFSHKHSSPWWLEKAQITSLMSSETPIVYMKDYIRSKVKDFIREPQNHIELIKSWITLKVLKADTSDDGVYLINYFDSRAVSAFKNIPSNYIVPSESFDWGNVLLGYSYSYTIYPARDQWNWNNRENLDSPLFDIPFIDDYYNKDKHQLEISDKQKMSNYINGLIENFLNTEDIETNTI
ncbi:MAG: DUF262 domain-containing protein [Prevotellaceae bacterium]|nr:DUF262 domain-containing protein [Candidatus Faecinaster equi]